MIKVGVVGCGDIFKDYIRASKVLNDIEIVACASRGMDSARMKAEKHGIRAMTVDELLADPEIEIVINLTTPQAHTSINLQALEAGKHVYCEKPFAITREEAIEVLDLARVKALMVGSAPDTFLGSSLQTCRKLIDDGEIGRPVAGTAIMGCHGHESWHPNPGFYYLKGGGPVFDMAPYYLSALVHLLGPVKRVAAICGRSFDERLATSESAKGRVLPVEVNTHAAGTLEFCNGAIITLIMSFDVWKQSSPPIEIHGTAGSLRLPEPNSFGGEVSMFRPGTKDWETVPPSHGYSDNMRSIGVADIARAIKSGRAHRCNGEMGYHVLDVMHAFDESSETGSHIEVKSTCEQPAALPVGLVAGELDD